MARFAIRPEINNASNDDYTKLHEEMYNRKIYRVLQGNDGIWYDLPTGTYNAILERTRGDFYKLAEAAVLAVVNGYIPAKTFELIVYDYSAAEFKLTKNTDKSKLPK
jgi:hypothetical protein